MIPKTTNREITRSGVSKGTEMAVASGQMKWIFHLLRTGIYKNKIRSLMREYMVNAQDEHRKYNVSRPVEITLPDVWNSEFKVRDFGEGLVPEEYGDTCICPTHPGTLGILHDASNEYCSFGKLVGGVQYFFGQYGASDKRESNKAVGFMGIGAKSAFCYTDNFIVRSFKDGTVYTFNLVIDESDKGEVNLMDTSNTTEPNGIEVTIPVSGSDYYTFQSEGLDLIKHFEVKPLIFGVETPVFETVEPLLKGSGWRLTKESPSIAIMGEIAYPIDTNSMGNVLPWEQKILDAGVEFDFAVGEVQVTASREELQMDKSTVAIIHERLSDIKSSMGQIVSEGFKNCKNLFDAKKLYYELIMTGGIKGIINGVLTEITWNGLVLKDSEIELKGIAKLIIYSETKNTVKRTSEKTSIHAADNLVMYLDDTVGEELLYRRRANTLLMVAGITQVIILQVEDRDKLVGIGIDPDTLPKFSDVTPTSLNRMYGGSGIDATKRVKHLKRVFELDTQKLLGSYEYRAGGRYNRQPSRIRGISSDFWNTMETEVDSEETIIVPIERFQPKSVHLNGKLGVSHDLTKLKYLLVAMEKAGITVPKIYGTKDKTNTFDVWVEKTIKELPDDGIALRKEFDGYEYSLPKLGFNTDNLDENNAVRVYHSLRVEATKWRESTIQAKELLFKIGSRDVPTGNLLAEARDKMYETYPMLKAVYGDTKPRKVLLEYVNDMDILNSKVSSIGTQIAGK
jgi:hypothetical protein